MAALRHRKFFSLEEANQAIGELLHRLNHRPFRKRDGSRASVFEALDKPALQPLPGRGSTSANGRGRASTSTITWPSTATCTACPTTWCRRWWRFARRRRRWRSCTRARGWLRMCAAAAGERPSRIDEHRPKSHQAHLEWPPRGWCNGRRRSGPTPRNCSSGSWPTSRTRRWAIAAAWASFGWPRSTRMPRMEAAAERALLTGACRYRSIESILKNSLDRQPLPASSATPAAATATARQHPRRGVLRVSQALTRPEIRCCKNR